MSKYIFILGRTPELSEAEINALLAQETIPFKKVSISKEVYIIETDKKLDIKKINQKLGGTVKIGQYIDEKSTPKDIEDAFSFFTNEFLVAHILKHADKKNHFGISVYNAGTDGNEVLRVSKFIEPLLRKIKSKLEQENIRSHFPRLTGRFLSSASVDKNKLLTHGAEILFLVTNNSLIIGKTLAVQEFEEFSFRDYGRPQRDMKSGIMPPKMARMMINLAQIPKNKKLLDPFCGSGTTLQEALYLGYQNILGTDISHKAVTDSQKNMAWLAQHAKFKESSSISIKIQLANVAQLSKVIPRESIAGIVTEPYLGPTLHRKVAQPEARKKLAELEKLYVQAFAEFYKVLEQNGRVVIALPALNTGKLMYTNIFSLVEKIGFVQEELSEHYRNSIVVGNKFDFVLREMVKFVKKS